MRTCPIYNAVKQYYTSKLNIKIKIGMGFLTHEIRGLSETMVFLSAANNGERAVTLSSGSFQLPDKASIAIFRPQSDVTFPHELLPKKSCQIWVEAKEIARMIRSRGWSGKVKLIGVYGDRVGRSYKSKPFKFDVGKWLKPSDNDVFKDPAKF